MSLPLSLRLTNRLAAIIGGGSVALRKAHALHEAGARIRVVAPEVHPEIRYLVELTGGELYDRPFEPGDLDDCAFVVVATNDEATNAAVVTLAHLNGILCCDAVQPERGDVTMLATVRVEDLTFTVDSGGGTPAFSQRIAKEIREHFGSEYAAASRTLSQMRKIVKATVPMEQRADVLRELANRDIELLARMTLSEAENAVEDVHNAFHEQTSRVNSSVICATRGSALALTQTKFVAARLALRGIATTLLQITTTGDAVVDRPIAAVGENVFIKELEIALEDRRADYAVHSAKDLPSTLSQGFSLAAISHREDPRDAFCSHRYRTFDDLPIGARVGTSSPRRVAQLRARRPDLLFEPIRGNIDTRLRKLRDGNFDAIILAMAGMLRLGIQAKYTQPFTIHELVPAVGQGALAIEVRSDDIRLSQELREAINDDLSERAVLCERAALAQLHAGCNAPIGIHAVVTGTTITVYAAALGPDAKILRKERSAQANSNVEAEHLGELLALELGDVGRV